MVEGPEVRLPTLPKLRIADADENLTPVGQALHEDLRAHCPAQAKLQPREAGIHSNIASN